MLLVFRFLRWRRLDAQARSRDPLLGSWRGRFLFVCGLLFLADLAVFFVSFASSLDSEHASTLSAWINTITLAAAGVLFFLLVLGVIVGPFMERRLHRGDDMRPTA